MRSALSLLLLPLAACGTGDPGNQAADRPVAAAVQTANLTGLYETPAGAAGSQMCILDRGTGQARFGLVLRDGPSCGGAGVAVRTGDTLSLEMAGDEPCTIVAAIRDRRVAFPDSLPAGCAYYCAPGASLAGLGLAKVGGTAEDAMRARDPVGDPLCG